MTDERSFRWCHGPGPKFVVNLIFDPAFTTNDPVTNYVFASNSNIKVGCGWHHHNCIYWGPVCNQNYVVFSGSQIFYPGTLCYPIANVLRIMDKDSSNGEVDVDRRPFPNICHRANGDEGRILGFEIERCIGWP